MNPDPKVSLAVDVFEYRRLTAECPEDAFDYFRNLDRCLDQCLEKHKGTKLALVVEASFLADFPTAPDALACAVELQRRLAKRMKRQPASKQAWARVGLNDNLTRAEQGATDFQTAWLLSLAEPGGICISRRVYDLVKSQLNTLDKPRDNAARARLWRDGGRILDKLNPSGTDTVCVAPSDLVKKWKFWSSSMPT
jgi:class 3 adenylate cyclase